MLRALNPQSLNSKCRYTESPRAKDKFSFSACAKATGFAVPGSEGFSRPTGLGFKRLGARGFCFSIQGLSA